jgi:hypothetical protein
MAGSVGNFKFMLSSMPSAHRGFVAARAVNTLLTSTQTTKWADSNGIADISR